MSYAPNHHATPKDLTSKTPTYRSTLLEGSNLYNNKYTTRSSSELKENAVLRRWILEVLV